MGALIPMLLPWIMEVIKRFIPDAGAQAEAQRQITDRLLENQAAIFEGMKSVMTADAQSGDPYTSRARPTVVYWSLGIISLIFVLAMFGLAEPVLDALKVIPTQLWDLMTYGIGAFILGRTGEKIASTYFESRRGGRGGDVD